MCTNYRPGSRDYIRERFGVDAAFDYPPESYPAYVAPIITRSAGGQLECVRACFGLIPFWAKDTKLSRSTYNARSETVASKPTFRTAWRERRYCLVPMESFYEPNYESGKPVRWRIERADHEPFAVAGIWETWRAPTSEVVFSFSMLTINADAHPVMKQFHAPGDEKRSVVVIDRERDAEWLNSTPDQAMTFLGAIDASQLTSSADPRPARKQAAT